MTHPSENELLALLDRELSEERRREIAAHIEGCDDCRAWSASLEAAASRFTAALRVLDAAAPAPDVAPPHGRVRRRRLRSWGTLARAAALVLVAAGAASAVIPGSPVREWVVSLAGALREQPALPAGDAVPVTPPAAWPAAPPAGISVLPEEGILRIVVTNFAPESSVRVRLVEGAEARVSVAEDAEARFRIAPGRIEVAGAGKGDLVVDLPRSASEATVEVDGRLAVLKRGEELQLLRPAVDSLQGDVRFRIGR